MRSVIVVIAGVIALVIVLAVLGFLVPKLSKHPERATQKTANAGGNVAGKLPGPLGRWGRKPFSSTSKWAGKGASAGRRGRGKTGV